MRLVGIDLDGTLISRNSFPLWVKHIFFGYLKSREFFNAARVLWLYFLRRAMIIDHANFKRRLMCLPAEAQMNSEFCKKLVDKNLNSSLVDYLVCINDARFFVTTAAPQCYAKYLPENLGLHIDNVIASKIEAGQYFENYGKNKVQSLQEVYGEKCSLFCTDHIEDLPMMKEADEVLLVRPSRATVDRVRLELANYEIFSPQR